MDYLVSAGLTSKKGMSNDEKKKKTDTKKRRERVKRKEQELFYLHPINFRKGGKTRVFSRIRRKFIFNGVKQKRQTRGGRSRSNAMYNGESLQMFVKRERRRNKELGWVKH